jgi:TolB protein
MLTTANAQTLNTVIDIAWNADGTLVAVSLTTGSVEVRSASTNQLVWSGVTDGETHIDWHPTSAAELAYVPLVGPITIVDVVTSSQLLQIPVDGYVNSIAYDPTGSRLLTSHITGEIGPQGEGYIRVFDRTNGQDTTTYERIGKSIDSAKWNNTGQNILALSDASLVIWDAATGQLIQSISNLELGSDEDNNIYEVGQMQAFGLNPINNDLSIAESILISFWDAPTYSVKRLETFIGGTVDLEWSADGSLVATATGPGRIINIIDPVTGEVLNTIDTSSNVSVLAWNPVTSELAIGEITATGEPLIIIDPENNSNLAIDSFTLINADTDQPITGYDPIAEGAMIDLAEMPPYNLSIRANTTPATVGSVVFDLNGTIQTDDTVPYDFSNWSPSVGSYTLTATPYSDAGGTGTAGTALAINFTIVDSGGTGGGPNQILFSSVTNPFTAATNIFVINPDGTGQTQLTTGTSIKNFPAWSPDGTQILYSSNQDGDDEIFVMNADGSNPVQLTTNTALDRFPVWSPDGTQIAFASRRDGNWEIYVMNADGTNPVNLTNNATDDFNVSWSPDGSQIAFASLRDASTSTDTEIYVMNADGTNVQRLTNSPSIDETPNWSPDGSQIAFTSNRNASNIDIYVMNADGTNIQRLTSYSGTDEFPNWSPDGTQIAFDSNRSSFFNLYFDIHTMNADGTNVQRITTRDAFDRFAAWGYP